MHSLPNTKGKMPKDFSHLTCFYWHTYGFCNKSDSDCLYAHYPTNVVATAPANFNTSRGGPNGMYPDHWRSRQSHAVEGPVAGHNAAYKLQSQSKREQHLQEWESRLQAKEMQLNGRQRVEGGVSCSVLRQVIATGRVSACKVRDALLEIEQLSESDDEKSVATKSIARATEAVNTLETDLKDLLQLLDGKDAKT